MQKFKYIFEFWNIQNGINAALTEDSNDVFYVPNKLVHRQIQSSLKSVNTYASLVPDMILNCDSNFHSNVNPCLGILMYVDISGFTPLSEKCAKNGNDGVFKLTSIVNEFFGQMIALIYELGGDVWKFSGDAFLAIWNIEVSDNIGLLTHKALFCALHIQKNLGCYSTDFGITLQVKIGMSFGNTIWKMVGDKSSRRGVMVGTPVIEVKDAEQLCRSGEVIVSASVWAQISPNDCVHQVLSNGFIKVTRLLGCLGLQSPHLLKLLGVPIRYNQSDRCNANVRDFSKLSTKRKLGSTLRSYTMSLVAQQIDADLPLKYINELRNLTLMFINIIPLPKRLDTELLDIVDKAYNAINRLVQSAGGLMEKVSMFDKDIVYLTVFGLRGFCDNTVIASCLHSGYDIREACLSIPGIKIISVGITTGLVYCGVVGHHLRREFTVMGAAVNKAARIMVEFPNVVTCDEATFNAAKLPSFYFSQHDQRRFKGFSSEDISYQFNADKMSILHMSLTSGIPPLLGRKDEMNLFRSIVTNVDQEKAFSIGIVGEEKSGKSRLLNEMIKELFQLKIHPVVVGLRKGHSLLPYGSAIYILCQALQLNKRIDLKDLKAQLKTLLQNELSPNEVDYINDLFDYEINCNPNEIVVSSYHKHIYLLAFHLGMEQKVLVVDDIHFCDVASGQLIAALIESHLKLVIVTYTDHGTPWNTPSNIDDLSVLPKIDALIKLPPLDPCHIAPLACQILKTQTIERQVLRFLESRCNGRPGWCKTYLESLMKNKYITIKKIEKLCWDDGNIVMPLAELLTPTIIEIDCFPIPSHPWNPTIEEIDSIEYNYQNFKSTLKIMTQQNWWSSVRQSLLDSSDNKHQKLQEDISIIPIKAVTPIVIPNFNTMKESKQWPVLVRNMFITETLKGLTPAEECLCCFINYEQSLINESVLIFNRVKNIKPRIKGVQNDMILDTLRSHQNMERFPEMRRSRSLINNDTEDIDNSERIVTLSSNYLNSDCILDRLSDKDNILCIAKLADIDLDAIKLDSHVNFISIFDNLKPFEQLVLKCASIIGIKFARSTLDAILHYPDSSLTSLAIMRLMDLNIFGCTKTLKLQSKKKCACQHILPDLSLPYYAFCTNLGFRYPGFKNVLYDILPPNQKQMFHKRAVECLSAEPIICLSCSSQETQVLEEGRRRSSMPPILNFTVRQKRAVYIKLSQNLLNVRWRNMSNCICCLVEMKRLEEIILQCEAADLCAETIKFKIKYAKSCIRKKKILEAEEIAKFLLVKIKANTALLSLEEKKIFIAETQILLGEVELKNEKLDKAFSHLLNALTKLLPFSVHISAWSFLHIYLPIFSKIWLHWNQERYSNIAGKALLLIAKILMIKKYYKEAFMVNAVSLKIFMKMNNLVNLCRAYGNQVDIVVSLELNLDDLCSEREMINLAFKMIPPQSIHEALSLGRLIHATYIRRTMGNGDLVVGLNFLQSMINLTESIPATSSRELLAVESVHVLTMLGKIREAVSQIMQLRTGGKSQQLWFHVLCLDFFRITGYWVEDPEESTHFIEKSLKEECEDPVLRNRAALTLQLWLLWTNPVALSSPIILPNHPQPVRNVTDCMCRVEELMALVLQANVPAAVLWWSKIGRILRTWISEVGIMSYKYKVMLPSYLHFRAYIFYRMENSVPRAQQLLEEAMNAAQEQGNELMTTRIALTTEACLDHNASHPSMFPLAKGKKWTEWKKGDWMNTLIHLP